MPPNAANKRDTNGKGKGALGFQATLWATADKQEQATETVLQQAKLLCADWGG